MVTGAHTLSLRVQTCSNRTLWKMMLYTHNSKTFTPLSIALCGKIPLLFNMIRGDQPAKMVVFYLLTYNTKKIYIYIYTYLIYSSSLAEDTLGKTPPGNSILTPLHPDFLKSSFGFPYFTPTPTQRTTPRSMQRDPGPRLPTRDRNRHLTTCKLFREDLRMGNKNKKDLLVGGFSHPSEKYDRQFGIISRNRGENGGNKRYLKPPRRFIMYLVKSKNWSPKSLIDEGPALGWLFLSRDFWLKANRYTGTLVKDLDLFY